ncbi:hypothetical protein SDC9_42559 [bioreactor metagenome]|uniref:Uncharacterized protein n=1 Tax=bioreactor metagenome TaxID=1076179 RepID=A0A644VY86_9ZZZZ
MNKKERGIGDMSFKNPNKLKKKAAKPVVKNPKLVINKAAEKKPAPQK